MEVIMRAVFAPFRWLYYEGPRWGSWGFWEGKQKTEICSEMTGTPVQVWEREHAECEQMLERKVRALSIFVSTLAYAYLMVAVCVGVLRNAARAGSTLVISTINSGKYRTDGAREPPAPDVRLLEPPAADPSSSPLPSRPESRLPRGSVAWRGRGDPRRAPKRGSSTQGSQARCTDGKGVHQTREHSSESVGSSPGAPTAVPERKSA